VYESKKRICERRETRKKPGDSAKKSGNAYNWRGKKKRHTLKPNPLSYNLKWPGRYGAARRGLALSSSMG